MFVADWCSHCQAQVPVVQAWPDKNTNRPERRFSRGGHQQRPVEAQVAAGGRRERKPGPGHAHGHRQSHSRGVRTGGVALLACCQPRRPDRAASVRQSRRRGPPGASAARGSNRHPAQTGGTVGLTNLGTPVLTGSQLAQKAKCEPRKQNKEGDVRRVRGMLRLPTLGSAVR